VQNFRCVQDSGWVSSLDDIAVIVGKNESGKTSVLKALWKFNPFHEGHYSLDREWPRGRRKDRAPEKTVVEAKFSFDDSELQAIRSLHESCAEITGVMITKNYAGTFSDSFYPANPSNSHDAKWTNSLIGEHLTPKQSDSLDENFKTQYMALLKEILDAVDKGGGSLEFLENVDDYKSRFQELIPPELRVQGHPLQNYIREVHQGLDTLKIELEQTPIRLASDLVHRWLPTFIYMDDHQIFSGSAQLDQILSRRDRKQLTESDETILLILKLSGLDLDEEVRKVGNQDREQRMLDLNDASLTLTNEIADRWSQKKYKVNFKADGHHFITFVEDVSSDGALVPLEERSKGFQWFFSFDMKFMHETRGNFKNAVLLLDEPGLHLHAAAQRDLLNRLKAYSADNQLIYTTHLPFMIDFKRLDNIYVAEEGKDGTKVHQNWATADTDARFTLQAALGLSWSQSLFVGQHNLVVEGVDDFWLLTTFSTLFEEAGQPGLNQNLVITPAGGASKVAYIGTILKGQKLNVGVLLDSDSAGQQAYQQLVQEWLLKDKLVLMLGTVIGVEPCAIEDLFGETHYVTSVQECYSSALSGQKIALDPHTAGKKTLVGRVEDALSLLGIRFNKGRVAKLIMAELAKKSLSEIDAETVGKFRKVIDAINGLDLGFS